MTKRAKDHPRQGGSVATRQAARQRQPGLQDEGLQSRQLLPTISRKKPVLKNRVPQEIEGAIVALAIEQPAFGQVRIANELRKRGHAVPPAGVRCVWLRHDPETMNKRLKALEAKGAQDGLVDRSAGHRAGKGQDREGGPWRVRERASGPLRRPGYILFRQSEGGRPRLPADLHRYLRQGRLRQALQSQDAITAADLLNGRVVSFFEEHDLKLLRVLTAAASIVATRSGMNTSFTSRSRTSIIRAPKHGHHIIETREGPPADSTPAQIWLRAFEATARFGEDPSRIFPTVIGELAHRYADKAALLSKRETLPFATLAARMNRYSRWALALGIAPATQSTC
jgi:hypothetical protein